MKRASKGDFSIRVVSIGDIIEVGDAVLTVVEGLPHHGRMGVDVDLYHRTPSPLLLC